MIYENLHTDARPKEVFGMWADGGRVFPHNNEVQGDGDLGGGRSAKQGPTEQNN